MTKREFIEELRKKLAGLPKHDVEERLNFYSEIIDDKIEDGFSEESAVSEIGSVDEIAEQILSDFPLLKLAKERIKPKRKIRAWEMVLLALGSPIWLSLGIAAAAVLLSLYVVLWSVIVSVWAVFVSLAACAVGGMIAGIVFTIVGANPSGVALIGAGMLCAGLAIFSFFGCDAATKGVVTFTKKLALGVKKCFTKKEDRYEQG